MAWEPPKDFSLAQAADLMYETRQVRYKVQHEADDLKKIEGAIQDWIIENLPKSDAAGITGRIAKVNLVTKVKATVEDWEKVYDYIVENEAWELLERRISQSSVKDRWKEGEDVPGVGKFNVIEVSCTKA